jgi:hypothetical protein
MRDNSIISELLQTLPNIKALMTTMEDEPQTIKVSSPNVATPETIEEEITNHFENFASKFLIDIQSLFQLLTIILFQAFKKYSTISTLKFGITYQWMIIFLKYLTSFAKDNMSF